MDPVVMALILGMVTVGDVACAVKGIAEPSRINLFAVSLQTGSCGLLVYNSRLGIFEAGIGRVDKIAGSVSDRLAVCTSLPTHTCAAHPQP